MNQNANLTPMTEEQLVELMARAQKRVEDNIARLRTLEEHISQRGGRILRTASVSKLLIVVLGALIATRAISDGVITTLNIGQDTPTYILSIVIPYTMLSVAIAILAGIDSAFKFGETGAEVNYLKIRCSAAVGEAQAAWIREAEIRGVSLASIEAANNLLERLDQHHQQITTRLVQLGIPLL